MKSQPNTQTKCIQLGKGIQGLLSIRLKAHNYGSDTDLHTLSAELRLPVSELDMTLNPSAPKTAEELLGNFTNSLKIYLQSHIIPLSMDGHNRTTFNGRYGIFEF